MPRKNPSATTSSTTSTKDVKSSKKSKKEEVQEPTEEVITIEDSSVPDSSVVEDSSVPVGDSAVEDSSKVPLTSESVCESFDEIIKLIDAEVENLRTSQTKAVGVKFLRSINKRLKLLKSKTTKVMKQRQRFTRKPSSNTNSGFLKPVNISKDMAKFTGWDPAHEKSRVEVTKYICKYIKDNNLQNPEDRRQILADDKLKKLLNYDPKKDDKLTYYKIQSYLKPHFIPTAPKA
jgi:upstream activation factor subunit UAF30